LTLSASGGRGICDVLQDAGLGMNTGLEDLEIHQENESDSTIRDIKSIT
jgi:hypothetical protein